MTLVAVMVAGGLGATARYAVDLVVAGRLGRAGFPWGTFLINVSGSFALGALVGLVAHGEVGPVPAAALGTGFLGGYTTFSTFAYETLRLVEEGAGGLAVANAAGSLVAGALAAAAGLLLTGP
ncbi:MAG: CrcB family protein [Euzebyaceae bacterium]|nr:CrcB family protein [Euzebyaceae bacterium]